MDGSLLLTHTHTHTHTHTQISFLGRLLKEKPGGVYIILVTVTICRQGTRIGGTGKGKQ